MNSPVYKDWIPRFDAAAVAALRRGGAVILGKTVTTEFAIGSSGPTTNPFNRNHTPGGSSSGSAAAVGAGMAPAALGTQTGGSILRPASYCGAIGFKPTIGTLHLGGVHPLSTTCDHLGVIAATLDDAWRVASQISLEAGGQGRRILPGPGGRLPAAVKPGKLIRLYTRGWRELDRGSQEAFDGLIVSLQAAGVVVEDRNSSARIARLEAELDAGVADGRSIVAYEMKWPYAEYAARFGRQMSPTIHGLLDLARRTRPATYDGWLRRRVRMQQQIEEAASGYAGFITLASSGPAPVGLRHTGSRTFQSYSSWLGLPAAALPLLRVDALPLGVQLMGRDGADRALFANARWLMRQFGEE
jgi:Asp-tRNA(Asn)/Glu-tRNA(Gln) amidotransferase A subunit family amidase